MYNIAESYEIKCVNYIPVADKIFLLHFGHRVLTYNKNENNLLF